MYISDLLQDSYKTRATKIITHSGSLLRFLRRVPRLIVFLLAATGIT